MTEAARDEARRCDALVRYLGKEIAVPRCAKRNERDGGLSEAGMIERSCPLAGKTEARRAEGRARDAER